MAPKRIVDREAAGVPIRLHSSTYHCDAGDYEVLYAGNRIPKKGGRVLDGWRKEDLKHDKVDYGYFDSSIDSYTGPLFYAMIHAPVVGTHGVLVFHKRGDQIVLQGIAVPEHLWGSGIAQKMLDRLERIAQARNAASIRLNTRLDTRAHSFFKQNGFKLIRTGLDENRLHPLAELVKRVRPQNR